MREYLRQKQREAEEREARRREILYSIGAVLAIGTVLLETVLGILLG